jgi:hypothetical protein
MVKFPETVGEVTLDEPRGTGPGHGHLPQRGVAAPTRAEPVRAVGERRLVVRLQQQAHHLTDQLVRPGRQAQRAQFPVAFRDVGAPHRGEPVALVAHRGDDRLDPCHGHAVRGLLGGSRGHRAVVGVDTPVGQQIQLRVEQLPIQFLDRQATPAAFTKDTQNHFGVLHFAYLLVVGIRSPGPLRPVDGFPALLGRA